MDESFSLTAGPVEGFTSIVWSERYFEPGTFRLLFPRSLLPEIAGARYVRTAEEDGEILCGRIEYLDTGDGGECEMRGHLLEILLADRVLAELPTLSSDPEDGTVDIAGLVSDAVAATGLGDRGRLWKFR